MLLKIALICGGPSRERGISLNSARSVVDHLADEVIQLVPFYVDPQFRFYRLSIAQLYSNTPADFDFKLSQIAEPLPLPALVDELKNFDLVFPVVHGVYGEDGELQQWLEEHQIPFVGCDSNCCRTMFAKHRAAALLAQNGFPTWPSLLVTPDQSDLSAQVERFFAHFHHRRMVVKPASGGSSIGVLVAFSPEEAIKQCEAIFAEKLAPQALIEPYCEGREFTVVVLQSASGLPVALIPTEIAIDKKRDQIFDYRAKYLPTEQVMHYTPPRLDEAAILNLCSQAEQFFSLFGMRDFARLDGWLMPDGSLYWTDFNPISGLEQNSFFFRQAAAVGLSHRAILRHLIARACERYQLFFPIHIVDEQISKRPVWVVFGGQTAERQVSVMSGTNVWLKLLRSDVYHPVPHYSDGKGTLWQLPYHSALHHTADEIEHHCLASEAVHHLHSLLSTSICRRLQVNYCPPVRPIPISQLDFLQQARHSGAFIFNALHGGEGEDGTWQRWLEEGELPFNGSYARASMLCMDKYATGKRIAEFSHPAISTLPKVCLHFSSTEKCRDWLKLWEEITTALQTTQVIVKPRADGCSAGVALLQGATDLAHYGEALYAAHASLPQGLLMGQTVSIEMSRTCEGDFLFEPYIATDRFILASDSLEHEEVTGWLELTIGILEQEGNYRALPPSITVSEGSILGLEEKFQGGTGVNLTPPPEQILSARETQCVARYAVLVARALGIQNYARLDLFFHRIEEKMIVIEMNTLPALTPSTVLYQQALADNPSISPIEFLENLIETAQRSPKSSFSDAQVYA